MNKKIIVNGNIEFITKLTKTKGKIILNNKNIDKDFCMLNLNNFEHQIIKLPND
ncbi:MAG TPA: hypothetical protein PLW77_07570 [Bacteroidales bacterium]|nr:hypothetical protein [Bacteroidales bacterium]HQB22215.1 hypothetical protein [Bacteroidales bacterium]